MFQNVFLSAPAQPIKCGNEADWGGLYFSSPTKHSAEEKYRAKFSVYILWQGDALKN